MTILISQKILKILSVINIAYKFYFNFRFILFHCVFGRDLVGGLKGERYHSKMVCSQGVIYQCETSLFIFHFTHLQSFVFNSSFHL